MLLKEILTTWDFKLHPAPRQFNKIVTQVKQNHEMKVRNNCINIRFTVRYLKTKFIA